MKRNILLSCLLYFVLSWCSLSFGIYYRIPYFARPASLGEAVVSIPDHATSIFYNPAGINSKTVSFSLTEWFLDTRAGSVAGSYNYKDYFTFGAGFSYFSYGQMRYFDEQGNPGEYFNADLCQYRISLAKQFNNYLSLGIGGKILNQNIETVQETEFSSDFGAIYYSKLFNIGASLHNPTICNSGTHFDLGVSVKPIKDLLLLGAMNYQDKAIWRTGVEYHFTPMYFRIGYNNSKLSGGIGYEQNGFSFDYALSNHSSLGLTHQFSITIK